MSGTETTAAKLATIDAAAADRGLTHLEFRLLWLMASAADRNTGVIRRKQTDLAEVFDVTTRRLTSRRELRIDDLKPCPINVISGAYFALAPPGRLLADWARYVVEEIERHAEQWVEEAKP